MKVTLEKQDKNLVHLAVEVDRDAVDRAWEKAYRQISLHVLIPGFRKGKAPRALVERHVGTDAMRKEALEAMVPDVYSKAVEEAKLEPIAQPQVLDVTFEKGQPALIKYQVEVRPDVALGDYLGIKVAHPRHEVAEAEVKESLDNVLAGKATIEAVSRPIQEGDVAVVDFEGKLDGVPFEGGKATSFTVEIAPGRFIPGFTEALVGMSAGETKTEAITFPEDYANSDLAGKAATFDFKVHEVRERRLPELTDELAKEFGADSASDLEAKVRGQLQEQAVENQEIELRKQLLDKIVATAQMELSEFMIKREIYFLLEQHFNQLARQGVDVRQMFNDQNRDEWEKRFEPEATKRIRTSLTLGAIARKEGLAVTNEEMAEAIVEYAQMLGRDAQQFQQELINNGRYAALADEVLSNKIIEWLYERADVEGREKKPEEPKLAEAQPEEPKPEETKAEAKPEEPKPEETKTEESAAQ